MAKTSKKTSGVERRGDSYRVRINRNGIKRAATFDSLDEAVRWRQRMLVEVEGRVDALKEKDAAVAASTLLRSVLKRYLEEVSPTKKGHRKEISRLNMWMALPWADLPVTSIRREHIREWRDDRIGAGKAPSTVYNAMNLLSAVFRHARSEWDLDVDNPVQGLKRPKQRRPREAVPDDRLEQLLIDEAEKSRARWLAVFIVIAGWTAMRAGEIASLQWRDVDFERHLIHLDDTKNGDARDVVMLPLVEEALARWLGNAQPVPDEWVFPSPHQDGAAINKDTPSASFAVLMRQIKHNHPDVERVTLHDLRHWGCTRLAPYHRDALHLSKTTGHRALISLARYYNPDPGRNAAEIRARAAVENSSSPTAS